MLLAALSFLSLRIGGSNRLLPGARLERAIPTLVLRFVAAGASFARRILQIAASAQAVPSVQAGGA